MVLEMILIQVFLEYILLYIAIQNRRKEEERKQNRERDIDIFAEEIKHKPKQTVDDILAQIRRQAEEEVLIFDYILYFLASRYTT